MCHRYPVFIAVVLAFAAHAAAERLPTTIIPNHYSLWLAPDFQKDTFRGRETIKVEIKQPATVITIHAAEIQFDRVRVAAAGKTQDAKVSLNEKAETATFTIPRPVPAGPATIEIAYTGILNDKLRGFYLSKANGRKYAVTQLEATDARRAFPSFDEPAYKAVFDISVMADTGDTVISNGAQISDTPGPDAGKHTVTFAPTLKMSTYLVAVLVGDFACREGSSDGIPIRVCATPDKKPLTGFALEAAQQQVKFYNEYYGLRYPFGKLDIIGVPDFAAGAMENTGAITFREQSLLADPQRASLEAKKTVAAVLSHEIAHQWFGDLVTMKWWDDIWLNEGFATWMANKPLAAWRPEWHVELDDVMDSQTALALDALRSTRAIRTQVDTPEEINEVFDAIAYQKSAGVLRMVESYVGENVFRRGVAAYLKNHAFGNANAENFWTEVARAADKPVDKIMASYVDQPGVHVLKVRTQCRGSSTEVTLHQDRFFGTPGGAQSTPQVWTLPVCMRNADGGSVKCDVMSQRDQTFTIPSCSAAVLINPGSRGYYFSEYDPTALATLTAKREHALAPGELLGLLGDEWWMIRAGRHDIGSFLDLAATMADDPTPALAENVTQRLAYAGEYLVTATEQPRFQHWIRSTFGPVLDHLEFPGTDNDDEEHQSRRATLAELLGTWGDAADIQQRARELALEYVADPASLNGTLAPTVLHIAALSGNTGLYEKYMGRLQQLQSEPEEYYRYFNALPYFRDPALVQRTLAFALSADVRTQDTGLLIAALVAQPWSREAAWTFTKNQWAALTERLGVFQGVPAVVGALGSFCSTEAAADIRSFFQAHPVAAVERTLQTSIERVESCASLRERQSPALTKWLHQSAANPASRP
jgi:puromycin-sensitive aminopeptidase